MKILISGGGTGGHLTPALALADTFRQMRPDIEIHLVGAERGIESQILPHHPYPFTLLPLQPIYRRQWWKNLQWPVLAVRLWRRIGGLLDEVQPTLVVGTGGYASGPVVYHAQRSDIATAIQESDARPGIATRWLSGRARQIHLGFPEAQALLRPGDRTEVFTFGNPTRPPEPGDRTEALKALGLDPSLPTLLVFGGGQGARAINYAMAGVLEHGHLNDVNLIWGTGAANFAGLSGYARAGKVVLQGFFDPMAPIYRAADLVVCRAGALTIAELCAWGKPSLLIPLPTAAANHQLQNARAMSAANASVLMEESTLTPHSLATAVTQLMSDSTRRYSMTRAALGRGRPTASRDVVSKLLTLVS
ncbi:MAG TPA: UDP-N-acetylglucosamine--N-acetylmuramyl-(pentapeptide) pyrophosphoryl-undecaprenol N-acetylglucosamine transferase [Gemmatimonadales bacterium]|nr:UDP-N-acetylglucosamine--N-acetylmuramyl-(pentapeptide) pyrophosphoryl-undecaprenol N-acetylglucosamine transferase [Gemmatimonadales bacterium]